MSKNRFFTKKVEFIELGRLVEIVEGEVASNIDKTQKIYNVATLQKAKEGDISFLSGSAYVEKFKNSQAQFCLVSQEKANIAPSGMITIICKNPYYAYSLVAKELYEEREVIFNKNSNISTSAVIGENCNIAPTAFIGDDVEIGDNCFIGAGVSILPGCKIGSSTKINSNAFISFCDIGNNCIIHSGVRIGQDGFGFAHHEGVNHKIIQLGLVEIANDVEIGANSCVDRGAIDNTKIGQGCKIDNLVQIAHNVEIGIGTVIAGCAAVAGSVKIGNYVQIGGNASVAGHIEIGDQSIVAGMSGVTKPLPEKSMVAGIPAIPIRKWRKMHATLSQIVEKK